MNYHYLYQPIPNFVEAHTVINAKKTTEDLAIFAAYTHYVNGHYILALQSLSNTGWPVSPKVLYWRSIIYFAIGVKSLAREFYYRYTMGIKIIKRNSNPK